MDAGIDRTYARYHIPQIAAGVPQNDANSWIGLKKSEVVFLNLSIFFYNNAICTRMHDHIRSSIIVDRDFSAWRCCAIVSS